MTITKVFIEENTFNNISIAGSLIYHDTNTHTRLENVLALINNSFSYIHSYVGANVIIISRLSNYFYEGIYCPNCNTGGILLANNSYREIIGCPTVDASVARMQT